MRTLKHVGTEMALHVLAYNMKRLMHILGVGGLIEAIRAQEPPGSSVAATSRCFSARLQRRRFRTDVTTSCRLFFMLIIYCLSMIFSENPFPLFRIML
jgi:hypothetical protein